MDVEAERKKGGKTQGGMRERDEEKTKTWSRNL